MNENLTRLCASVGKPDWKIAADCDMHPTMLSLYKNGWRRFSLASDQTRSRKNLAALAAYFDVSEGQILGSEPLPETLVRVTERSSRDLMPKEWRR